jgi:hypothetical protein
MITRLINRLKELIYTAPPFKIGLDIKHYIIYIYDYRNEQENGYDVEDNNRYRDVEYSLNIV